LAVDYASLSCFRFHVLISTTLPVAILLLVFTSKAIEDPAIVEALATIDAETAAPGNPSLVEGSLRIRRGEGVSIWVPPAESLEFRVDVDLGVLGDASVGTVTMSSGVDSYVASLPRPGESLSQEGDLVGWVKIAARGGHLGYELDHTITTRFLPQTWPSLINSEEQKGSENRKKEIKIGLKDNAWTSEYRANSHCRSCTRREHFVKATLPWNKDYHCSGCKRGEHRLWNPPKSREIPVQACDILGAVYLARNLVRDNHSELELFMLQKSHLWKVRLRRGKVADIKVSAGTFRCREVKLEVSRPEGESPGESQFSGLFGIKGALKIWLHESTGVPVLIEGDVPIGDIVDLHARIRLTKYQGTPSGFKPGR
jgi:hypothetical protein